MYRTLKTYDYLIIGAGIIGLTCAYEILKRNPKAKIVFIEKENDVAKHASGRNSGVLHAGFYYTADSLKARFTADGNRLMKVFCKEQNIPVNFCQKVVIAQTEEELDTLEELKRRADLNQVPLEYLDEAALAKIDSNVKSHKKALLSPETASVNPVKVCQKLKEILVKQGVLFFFNDSFKSFKNNEVRTKKRIIKSNYIINSAGLYADKIAKRFGFSSTYSIMPFKGIYLNYNSDNQLVRTNVYPVPNLKNPFLGVHYTVTASHGIKIGPTAIPAFWRENYKGFSRFRFTEFFSIIFYQLRLFLSNRFNFRSLAFEEMKKYKRKHFIALAKRMLYTLDEEKFNEWSPAGIRAQLIHKKSLELVQDFVIEGDHKSTHILNAVSPAFTCSFAFANYLVDEIESKKLNIKV